VLPSAGQVRWTVTSNLNPDSGLKTITFKRNGVHFGFDCIDVPMLCSSQF
jgi:hypothetical protein